MVTLQVPAELAPEVQRMIERRRDGIGLVIPVLLGLIFAALAGAWTWIVLVMFPRAEDLFKDFKIELPGLTKWFVMITHSFGGYGWAIAWVLPMVVPVAVVMAARKLSTVHGRALLMVVVALAVFGMIALLMVTYVAMILPMISLIQTVSGGGNR